MISELRRKIIIVAMLSVLAVLFAILFTMNLTNYLSVDSDAEERMDLLMENGGSFLVFMQSDFGLDSEGQSRSSDFPDGAGSEFSGKGFGRKGRGRNNLSAETPFDTRYFTVSFDEDGSMTDLETDRIISVSDDEAEEMARAAMDSGKIRGYMGDFKYRVDRQSDCTFVAFLDCSRELSAFRIFLRQSILVGAIGTIAFLVLVILFSGIVTRPVAEAYNKQKRFITDASHEIKTPLSIIEANTEVIEMENGESEWTKSTARQISRLSSLTEKLVFLTRMDEGSYKMELLTFDLSEAIRDTIDSYEGVCEVNGKTISAKLPDAAPYHGNEENIRRMLSLLFDNAIKYSSQGAAISLSMKPKGRGHYIITMENPADNLSPGNLDVLFERFYRSDASRSAKTSGHGIGLSVVAAIVRHHKGKIHAQSPDGKSIIFTITL